MENANKPMYMSKTLIGNIIMAALAYMFPQIKEFLGPENMVGVATAVNVGLRLITSKGLKIK